MFSCIFLLNTKSMRRCILLSAFHHHIFLDDVNDDIFILVGTIKLSMQLRRVGECAEQMEEESETRIQEVSRQLVKKDNILDKLRAVIARLQQENSTLRDKHSSALLEISTTHVQLTQRLLETPKYTPSEDTSRQVGVH